jgi:hypothetical protein
MPRPAGSKNKATLAAEAFIRQVELALKRGESEETLVNLTCRALTDKKNPMIGFAALKQVLEMKFGKPKQTSELTGEGGGAIVVKVQHVGN